MVWRLFLRGTVLPAAWTFLAGPGSGVIAGCPQGGVSHVLRASAGSYAVTLRSARTWARSEDQAAQFWGGAGRSDSIIVALEVSRGRTRVWVPLSSYSDLANVHKLRLSSAGSGCKVLIIGGDASTSYLATIRVSGLDVVGRSVQSGEFPNYWHEKTVYTNRKPPDN